MTEIVESLVILKEEAFERDREKRGSQWFITINNFCAADIDILKKNRGKKYMCMQSEIGKKKGNHHLHAVLQTEYCRPAAIKKLVPRANIQVIKNLQCAREYCLKADTWAGYRFEANGNNIIQEINDDEIINNGYNRPKQRLLSREEWLENLRKEWRKEEEEYWKKQREELKRQMSLTRSEWCKEHNMTIKEYEDLEQQWQEDMYFDKIDMKNIMDNIKPDYSEYY